MSTFHVRDLDDVNTVLGKAVGSDTRVFLLHCSRFVDLNYSLINLS